MGQKRPPIQQRIQTLTHERARDLRSRPTGVEAKLLIELDGGQHAEAIAYDESRTAWLESQGYRVLRFRNNDVMQNMEGVLMRIVDVLSPPPQPSPLKGEGVTL